MKQCAVRHAIVSSAFTVTELDSLRELLAPSLLAVELRNRDWVTGDELSGAIDDFKSRKVTFVLVDASPARIDAQRPLPHFMCHRL